MKRLLKSEEELNSFIKELEADDWTEASEAKPKKYPCVAVTERVPDRYSEDFPDRVYFEFVYQSDFI